VLHCTAMILASEPCATTASAGRKVRIGAHRVLLSTVVGACSRDLIGDAVPGLRRLADPFLYSTRRGYHILTHNLHGIGGRTVDPIAWWVGYAFSPNFIDWRYSHEPVATNTFTSLENGETVTLRGRERPQLLLSDDGVPEALFSGAVPSAGAPPQLAGTFTFVQPVRNVPRGPR
jgi:hypothetical protein